MSAPLFLVSIWLHLALGAPNFDPEEARRFASLASVTYCDQLDVVQTWTCNACIDSHTRLQPGIKVIDAGVENASRTLIGKLQNQSGCLVAFRGTDNFENQLKDLEFWEQHPGKYPDCDGCEVHTGFYSMWLNIHKSVLGALHDFGCAPGRDPALHLTGHSLGGALVALSMFTFDNAGFEIQQAYTFEMPRVGNQAFSDEFSSRFGQRVPFFRVTHHMDPVLHYPPLFSGYRHVPTEVYYDDKGTYKICNGAEDDTCADQFMNVPDLWVQHVEEHCGSTLVPNRNICNPVGCLNVRDVIV